MPHTIWRLGSLFCVAAADAAEEGEVAMYERGDLCIAPGWCSRDENGDCPLHEHSHIHPLDSALQYKRLFGGVFLPHSCDSWVIGGVAEIDALIEDLRAARFVLTREPKP